MARVAIENLSKRYGENFVVKDLSIDIPQGEFLVLLGPSGCGKTTTLRMIAGFVEPSSGRITLGGRDVTTLPPWKRNTGLVFQSYALFPHLSVQQNVAFGLEMRRMPAEKMRAQVAEALRLVRLEGFGERLPRQLSGGQQQRVALARALAFRPDVLLLDEPLSNLDAKLREEVRVEIRELQQKLGLTTVMVTHDQDEALSMADRLVVMAHGEVRQIGTQRDLYERPAGRFVAGFVGRSNFLEGKAAPDGDFIERGRPSHRMRRRERPARGRLRFVPKPSRSAARGRPSRQFLRRCGRIHLLSRSGPRREGEALAARPHHRPNRQPVGRGLAEDGRDVEGRLAGDRRPNFRRGSPRPARAWAGPANISRQPKKIAGRLIMRKFEHPHPSRRAVLAGAAALAAPALLRGRAASAEESKKIIVGTWGGDYANLLHKNIEMPFLEAKGWEVVQDTKPTRRAAPRWSPRSACRAARATCRPFPTSMSPR